MNLLRSLPGLALVCSSPFALAQAADGPYWNQYQKPANATGFQMLGSTFLIETPTAVHFFSGQHRTWTVLPVTAPQPAIVTNSYAIVQDGNTYHAWSTRSGQVASLTVGAGGGILDVGSTSSSWVCFVIDNNTAYAYSGLFGQWVPLNLQGTLSYTGIGSHAITMVDGAGAHGFSAFHGNWVSTAISGTGGFTSFRNGSVGTFSGPDEVHAFSAYANTWVSAPYPHANVAVVTAQDALCLIDNGSGLDVMAFGVLHGTLTRQQMAAPVTLLSGPEVAVLHGANGTYGYSPGLDAFVPLPGVATPAEITVAGGSFGCYALLDTGSAIAAFCGLTGNTTNCPIYDSFAWTLGETVAFGRGAATGTNFAYSALRDGWVQEPSGQLPSNARPMYEAMLLEMPNGFTAFSARKGTWSPLSSGANAIVHQTSGTLCAVIGNNAIDAFDPVLGRWQHQATAANPQMLVWRLCGIAHDGSTGYGYSLFTNAWESVACNGPVLNYRANSSIGYVETATDYYVFTASGSLTNYSRFPEFSRFVVRGVPLQQLQTGAPGSLVFGMVGLRDAATPTPFGVLRVDPALAVSLYLGSIPGDRLLRTQLPVPNLPALTGLSVALQDFVIEPSGRAFLSNGLSPILW